MSAQHKLEAQQRDISTKGAIRKLRQEGKVPGILYGNNQDNTPIVLDRKALQQEVETPGFFGRTYLLKVGSDKEVQVLPKELQVHPVTDGLMHIDFQRIAKDARIHVFVSVNFINEDKSPGIKQGGILNIIHHKLELICPANAVPEALKIDLNGTQVGHTVHADVLDWPKDVKLAHPERDNTIATIVAPKGTKAGDSGEAEGTAS